MDDKVNEPTARLMLSQLAKNAVVRVRFMIKLAGCWPGRLASSSLECHYDGELRFRTCSSCGPAVCDVNVSAFVKLT